MKRMAMAAAIVLFVARGWRGRSRAHRGTPVPASNGQGHGGRAPVVQYEYGNGKNGRALLVQFDFGESHNC
jgi:hypothetical protein